MSYDLHKPCESWSMPRADLGVGPSQPCQGDPLLGCLLWPAWGEQSIWPGGPSQIGNIQTDSDDQVLNMLFGGDNHETTTCETLHGYMIYTFTNLQLSKSTRVAATKFAWLERLALSLEVAQRCLRESLRNLSPRRPIGLWIRRDTLLIYTHDRCWITLVFAIVASTKLEASAPLLFNILCKLASVSSLIMSA